jgi:hypothetical protein
MEKETAKSIISLAFSMGKKFDDILLLLDKETNDIETKEKFVRIIQDLIGHICIDLVMPIVDIYPDLNPDK